MTENLEGPNRSESDPLTGPTIMVVTETTASIRPAWDGFRLRPSIR